LRGQVPPLPGKYVDLDLGVTGPMARNAGALQKFGAMILFCRMNRGDCDV
jgi:hypothetical protein